MKSLDLQVAWPKDVAELASEADATMASLRVFVEGENATSHVDLESGAQCDHVEQPMLHLAEWVVENWWSLLWEPEKTEDPDSSHIDQSFLARHSIMVGEQGFALPDLRLIPTGAHIQIIAKPRVAEYADVRFPAFKKAQSPRAAVENELSDFVNQVVSRLRHDATLRDAWSIVQNTAEDAVEFCKLLGSLGLSPYRRHLRVEAALDKASECLSREELFDLCQGATAEDFVRSAKVAALIDGMLKKESNGTVNLQPLKAVSAPADNFALPAYKRGRAAAKDLRGAFGVGSKDITGASRIFDFLEVDPTKGEAIDLKNRPSPLSGAIARSDTCGKIAIVHQAMSSRRFAAARAAYFLWTGKPGERRLMTNSVTRSQQASRAFAAELLVPQEIVRSRASNSRISWDQVSAIAEEAGVAPEMVMHQATNSGLHVLH